MSSTLTTSAIIKCIGNLIMVFYLPIYKVGEYAYYRGRPHEIEHILISGFDIFVKLNGVDSAIASHLLKIEPTKFEYRGKSGDGIVS